MKTFTILAALVILCCTRIFAQLSPLESTEFCPNQAHSFVYTVTGEYVSAVIVNTINCTVQTQASVVYNGTLTIISFSVQFTDDNRVQHKFTINRTPPGSNPTVQASTHTFTKIRSHAQSKLITGLPASLNVPFCTTNAQALSFTATKWLDATVNPATEFGTVSAYKYVIPAGWTLNGQTSNGSTGILGLSNVALVPHPLTGGDIKITPVNNCGGGLVEGNTQVVPITGRQTISLTANGQSTVKYFCGDQTAKTIVLQNATLAACITGYTWNLGANNGWLYNGSAAPASIVTATPTITLTPSCNVTALPSNISVTTSGAVGTFSIVVEKIPPPIGISGYLGICSSAIYSIPAPCGSTVTWSASPVNIVGLTPNGSQVTVSTSSGSNGTITLTANVVTSCGDNYTFTKIISVGSGTMNVRYRISNNGPYFFVNFPNGQNGVSTFGPAGGYAVDAYVAGSSLTGTTNMTWTLQGGYGYTGYGTSSSAGMIHANWNFPPATNFPTVALKLTVTNNGCTLERYPVFLEQPGGGMMFHVSPNPATDNLLISKQKDAGRDSYISEVRIFDMAGRLRKAMHVNNLLSVNLPVYELKDGVYIVEVTSGNYTERKKIKIIR